MDRNGIDGKNLHDLDLAGLAELCGSVARHLSADHRQSETARDLRAQWVRLSVRFRDDKTEAEERSLKKRMVEFLAELPDWMMSGV